MEQVCAGIHCGRLYMPNPKVKNQHYCSRPECQRERKAEWHKRKLRTDTEYRQNRSAAQQGWRKRHPDYWRNNRRAHPDYRERNRVLQRARNQQARSPDVPAEPPGVDIAKMDSAVVAKTDALGGLLSGTYQLIPMVPGVIAKTDALLVQLSVLSSAYG